MTADPVAAEPTTTPWPEILTSWDVQQAGYLPRREERFAVMSETAGDLVGDEFLLVDLGCGPGSLTQRLVDHRPGARAVAVDSDPVLLRLARECYGDLDGRVHWVDTDLRDDGWAEAAGLAPGSVDVVASTTALHWLDPGALHRLYAIVARLLRPGGVFLNGDNMTYDHREAGLRELARLADARASHRAFAERGVPDWGEWWNRTLAIPALAEDVAERERRIEAATARWGDRSGVGMATLRTHVAALLSAGFVEVDTVWQHRDDRVLVAVR